MNIDSKQRTQLAVALGAVVALVLGFSVFGKSDDNAQTNTAAQQGNFNGQYGNRGPRGLGGPGGPGGRMPQQVTGSKATKAKAAAEKEVDGTAEVVLKSRSGSGYTVIVRADDGVTFVQLDNDFKVTGTREMQGGPPGQGQGGQPPAIQGGDVQ